MVVRVSSRRTTIPMCYNGCLSVSKAPPQKKEDLRVEQTGQDSEKKCAQKTQKNVQNKRCWTTDCAARSDPKVCPNLSRNACPEIDAFPRFGSELGPKTTKKASKIGRVPISGHVLRDVSGIRFFLILDVFLVFCAHFFSESWPVCSTVRSSFFWGGAFETDRQPL